MRVIAGSARGIRLTSPPGMSVRPTSDRAKEALFSILSRSLPDARVLDLFCGSGALAIEALSRGGGSATLVDLSSASLSTATANVESAGLSQAADFVRSEATAWVKRYSGDPFDLIFADPPYDLDPGALLVAIGESSTLLDEGAVLVLERSSKDDPPIAPEGLTLDSSRRYGAATFYLFAQSASAHTRALGSSTLMTHHESDPDGASKEAG